MNEPGGTVRTAFVFAGLKSSLVYLCDLGGGMADGLPSIGPAIGEAKVGEVIGRGHLN